MLTLIDLSPIHPAMLEIMLSFHTPGKWTRPFSFVRNLRRRPDLDLIAGAIPEVVQEAAFQSVCVKHTGIATKHFILKLEGPPHRHNTDRGQMETSLRPQSCSQNKVYTYWYPVLYPKWHPSLHLTHCQAMKGNCTAPPPGWWQCTLSCNRTWRRAQCRV